MSRSTETQKTERLNAAHGLLARGLSVAEAALLLSRQFTLSRRQAYRYIEAAQTLRRPVRSGHAPTLHPARVGRVADGVVGERQFDRPLWRWSRWSGRGC